MENPSDWIDELNKLLEAYPDAPEWFQQALLFNGMRETLPDGSLDPRVRGFFAHTNFPSTLINAETAWCAAFCCAMLERTGYKSPHSAAAKDFAKWGIDSRPVIGAFVVMPRTGGSKHVTMWAGTAGPGHFLGYGGNQGNHAQVNVYEAIRIEACRMPSERRYGL